MNLYDLCFCLVISAVSFGKVSAGDIAPRIHFLQKSYRTGQELSCLLSLPASDSCLTTWAIYFADARGPAVTGLLDSDATLRDVKLPIVEEGTYMATLVLLDEMGKPKSHVTADVTVLGAANPQWISVVLGPISGALAAVMAFLVQEGLAGARKKRMHKRKLSMMIHYCLREHQELDAGKLPPLPSWLSDPYDSDWTIYLSYKPFADIVHDFMVARQKYAARTMVLGRFYSFINDLISRLPS